MEDKNDALPSQLLDSDASTGSSCARGSDVKKEPSTRTENIWRVEAKLGQHDNMAAFTLAPGEEIIAPWTYESTSLSLTEWIASFLSFGLYYLISRVILRRKRHYAVAVTNLNVHIKEEMVERSFFCTKTVFENQITHPITSLAYVCAEEMEPQFCGLFPASVSLELRFHKYPVNSEVPLTPYHSIWHYIRIAFGKASTYAFKNAFNVNFDSSPVVLAVQLMQAIPLMTMPSMWLLWAFWAAVSLMKQLFAWVGRLLIAVTLNPVVGPLQAVGAEDGRVCRFAVNVSESHDCHQRMQSILRAISQHIPDRNVVPMSVGSRLVAPPQCVYGEAGPYRNINRNKAYGEDNEFQILDEYLHIPPQERIVDMCPVNPTWTLSDVKAVIFSLGLYYLSDLRTIMAHRVNSIFTTTRHIQHSVLLSFDKSKVAHSRLEFWVLDASCNVTVTEFRRQTHIHVISRQFGWSSFRINKKASAYFMFLFRTVFRPRLPSSHVPGLCTTPREEWERNPEYEKAKLTRQSFTGSEVIDVAVYANQRLYSCLTECLATLTCSLCRYETVVTCTNECLYIEYMSSKTCSASSKVFVVIPWCDVDGVFWQNHDAGGPTCCMAWLLACMCPIVFGCCCCVCSGAAENKSTYYDQGLGGHKGCVVSICPRGSKSFRLGIAIPNRYYGMNDRQVNALVDSISLRALRNLHLGPAVTAVPVSAPVVQVQPGHTPAVKYDGVSDQEGSSVLSSDESSVAKEHAQANPSAPAPVEAVAAPQQGFTVTAVEQSVHHSQYISPNKHNGDVRTMNRAGCKLHFPIGTTVTGCHSLTPGETVRRTWRTETTRLETWEVIIAFFTFGIYYFYRLILYNTKRFLTLRVTDDRVLISEEIILVRFFVTHTIYENQTAFRLEDLCYLNCMEVGPAYCGCIPPRTFLSLRFGHYPKPADIPRSADSSSQKARSNRSIFTIAHLRALARVYGIYDNAGSVQAAEQEANKEMKFETWLGQTIDYMHYIYVIIAEVVKQFLHVLWEIVRSVFLYRRESTGASHLEEGDGRLFTFYFKTTDAVNKCKDIVDTLSALVCAKQGRLPPPNLSAISSPRYEISEQVVPVNASDKYGKDGGFFVLRRMWDLLDGEVVYDVLPTNYRISWRDLILCVITAGLYYLFRLHGRRRCRQSYMLTDRRLVSHAVRKAVCGSTVIYSCLQMWFLCPTLSFTIMRKKKSCCKYKSEFVTDSTRFGVLNLDICNEPFMCTYLQVVGALSTSAAEKRVEAGSSKALIHDVAEMKQARFCQLFLEAGGEATLGVLGSTFPVACLQRLCWRQPVHCVLAVTSSAIYLEVYTKSVQIFTRIPTVMLRSVYCSNVQTRSALCCWKNSETYQYPLLGYSGAQIRMNIMGSNGFQTGLVLPGRYHGRPEDQELSDLSSLLKRQASRLHLRDVIALSDIMLDGGMED